MWSLRSTLASIGPHLPDGFLASSGIRVLFPAGESVSISLLSQYVYVATGVAFVDEVTPDNSPALAFLGADGAGRWFFGWVPPDQENSCWSVGFNQRAQAGFVFLYSADQKARGFVANSRSAPNPWGYPPNCFCGVDGWISANWTRIFSAGSQFEFLIADGLHGLPNASVVWTSAGFQDFVSVQGAECTCAVTGSVEFPFSSFPDTTPPSGSAGQGEDYEAEDVASFFLNFLDWWWWVWAGAQRERAVRTRRRLRCQTRR